MKARRSKAAAWLVVLAISFLLVHLVQKNWMLRARLNLLLRGYVFCGLVTPDAEQLATLPTNEFVLKLVYKGDKCVGFLDASGQFIGRSDNAAGWDSRLRRDMAMTVVLCYLKWLLVGGFAVVAMRVLSSRTRRVGLAAGEKSPP